MLKVYNDLYMQTCISPQPQPSCIQKCDGIVKQFLFSLIPYLSHCETIIVENETLSKAGEFPLSRGDFLRIAFRCQQRYSFQIRQVAALHDLLVLTVLQICVKIDFSKFEINVNEALFSETDSFH